MALVLGFLTGIVLVMPVGPTSLSLVGVGTQQGRRAALAGAGGVVSADLLLLVVAVRSAGTLAALHPSALRLVEALLGAALLVAAVLGVTRTGELQAAVTRIRRPARALLAVTLCNPMTLVSWAGLVLALPAGLRTDGGLVPFVVGVVVASAVWHAGLALLAGTIGTRLSPAGNRRLVQASCLVLGVIGVVLVAG